MLWSSLVAVGLLVTSPAPRAPLRASSPSPHRVAPASIAMSTRGVVITGGAGGVGYAYADTLMRMGHWVVICDVKDPAPAVRALEEKHAGGIGRVHGTVCDVSDAESVEALGAFAKEKLGTIHYWINNAGINGGGRSDLPTSTSGGGRPRQPGRRHPAKGRPRHHAGAEGVRRTSSPRSAQSSRAAAPSYAAYGATSVVRR